MNLPTDIHEPTAEFRGASRMADRDRDAARVAARRAGQDAGWRGLRSLGTILVVVVALAIGGAAGVASERVQDAQVRNQLVANAQAEEVLVQTRLELAKAAYQEARKRFEVGTDRSRDPCGGGEAGAEDGGRARAPAARHGGDADDRRPRRATS